MTSYPHHVFAMPAGAPTLVPEAVDPAAPAPLEDLMKLPFLSAVRDEPTAEVDDDYGDFMAAPEPFRILADFQDVIDSAADAGLIDDEAAVVFHRQLIAWSRGTGGSKGESPDAALDAARAEAAAIIERAQAEVAEIRKLTLEECDNILDAARAAAEHIGPHLEAV